MTAGSVGAPGSLGVTLGTTDDREVLKAQVLLAKKRERARVRWRIFGYRALGLVVLLGGWELCSRLKIINPVLISEPYAVGKALVKGLQTASLWHAVVATFEAALLSAAIGATLGIVAGVILYRSPVLYQGSRPLLTILNSLPRPALAPIFILWLGLGVWAKVAVGVSVVFFMMLLNTIAGFETLDADVDQLCTTLGMNGWQKLILVELPNAVPSLIAGLRLAVVYSVLGVIVSEMVASYQGLGQVMVQDSNSFDMAGTFAVLVLLAVLTTLLDQVVSIIQRRAEKQRQAYG